VVALLAGARVPFAEISVHRASLEEAYLELTAEAVEFRAAEGPRPGTEAGTGPGAGRGPGAGTKAGTSPGAGTAPGSGDGPRVGTGAGR
jgi:hypothetical protein